MGRSICTICCVLFASLFNCEGVSAQSIDPLLITVTTGRQHGFFTKEDALQKAAVFKGASPTTTALLIFRGWPGIARLETGNDAFRSLFFFEHQIQLFAESGISLVIVDCPTDQWAGSRGPVGCDDDFRSSQAHADDIRKIINVLRADHGYASIYVFGHSYGTISSKWLAFHLGDSISGSVHSAAQTQSVGAKSPYGYTSSSIKLDQIKTPVVHIHHADDQCFVTPYSVVKDYAGKNLISVYGGGTSGISCGGKHYHSYEGREAAVSKAIIRWIKTGEVEGVIGRD
jgi:hypothetical protein